MICDFCQNTIPDDSFSCPCCGAHVSKTVSSSENPVISLEQQAEIGNYKSNISYKISSNEPDEDDPFTYRDITRKAFAAQKFTSGDNDNSYHSPRGILIQNNNSPNDKKYTMQNYESGESVSQSNRKKRPVSLKKERKAVNLSKETTGFIDYSDISGDSESVEDFDGCIKIEPGLTKNQLLSLHNLKTIRQPFYSSIVLLYASMVMMIADSRLISSLYPILCLLLVLVFTYGIQFKHSYFCAVACACFGLAFFITGMLFYSSYYGLLFLIGGILASISIKKFNVLWTQYQETGKLPFNP